jgi:hypothetical protein
VSEQAPGSPAPGPAREKPPLPISAAEMALLRGAAKQWGVPDLVRDEALAQCYAVLKGPFSTRNKLAAARLIATLDRCDHDGARLALEQARVKPPEEIQARDVWDDDGVSGVPTSDPTPEGPGAPGELPG